MESLLCSDQMQRVWGDPMAAAGQSPDRQIERLPELLTEKSGSEVVGQTLHSSEAEMHEPEGSWLQELRSPGDRVPLPECDCGLSVHDREPRVAEQGAGAGSDRCERALRAGESPVGNTPRELPEPEASPRKVKVYDIVNAGPRHRFTVSGVLVHNCGYGGGVGALRAFGADKMGLTEDEMQDIVTQWRQASPAIPKFWQDAERAAKTAIQNPGRTTTLPCGVKYYRDADALRCKLPSGRVLSYWNARMENGRIVFMGQNQTTKKWEKTDTWGGKLVENIVQAFARDCLAVALIRLDAAGHKVVFHVHDEVIVEAAKQTELDEIVRIMDQPIDWAPGLLLRGEGYVTPFYMKD